MSLSETDICRKLLVTLHLNVPERQALPDGRARFSVLVEAAAEVLGAEGWLPPDHRPDHQFNEVVIEARSDGYWVHERHEVGQLRFSPVRSRRVGGLEEAVRARLERESTDYWGGAYTIDGVPIDYSA